MKRRYLKTAIVGLLFVGLVYYTLHNERGRVAEEGEVFALQGTEISGLSLQALDYTYTLSRQGEEWWVTAPFSGMADPEKVKPIIDAVAALKAAPRPKEKLDNPDFGLQTPALTLVVTYRGGRTATIKLGAQSPMEQKYFASISGRSGLFVIDPAFKPAVDQNPQDLRDRKLARLPEPEKATLLRLASPRGQLTVTRTPLAGEPTWEISAPRKLPADQPAVDGLLRLLGSTEAVDYLPYTAANVDTAGLRRPTLTLTYQLEKGQPITLWFGKEESRDVQQVAPVGHAPRVAPQRVVYATSSARREILVLPDSLLVGVDKSLLDLRDNHLVLIKPDQIASVSVERVKGLSFKANKSGAVWELTAPKSGTAGGRLQDLLTGLGNLQAARYEVENQPGVDLAKYGLQAPETVLTLGSASGGEPLVVAFGNAVPGEPGHVYAHSSQHNDVYVVDDAVVRALPEKVEEVLQPAGAATTLPNGRPLPPGVQIMPPDGAPPGPPGPPGGPHG